MLCIFFDFENMKCFLFHCLFLSQVALLSGADEDLQEVAFQYGRNVGIAFQLLDDLLDLVASSNMMGKPTVTDLKLGLATAPVLFACEKVGVVVFLLYCRSFSDMWIMMSLKK